MLSTGSIAAPANSADVNARSLATSLTMTASGIRKAIATIDVTAAETSASVVLTDVRPCATSTGPSAQDPHHSALTTGRSPPGVQHDADAAHSVQIARPRGRLPELAAQPRDVHVDGLVIAVRLMPHLRQQFLAGDHRAGPDGQVRQQVELAAGELQAPAVQLCLPPSLVDAQAADGDNRGCGARLA